MPVLDSEVVKLVNKQARIVNAGLLIIYVNSIYLATSRSTTFAASSFVIRAK